MKIPKKIYKPALISIIIVLILAIILIIILGFDTAQKILSFISSIIGLPTAISSFYAIIYIIDEGKLINRTLIEAGKKDKEEWEKMKKLMEQCNQ